MSIDERTFDLLHYEKYKKLPEKIYYLWKFVISFIIRAFYYNPQINNFQFLT